MSTPEFPSNLKALQHLADTQPELVQELYHWALAMVMVERGKIQLVERHSADGREQVTFKSPEGEVLTVTKPVVLDTEYSEMMTAVRAAVEAESQYLPPHSDSHRH